MGVLFRLMYEEDPLLWEARLDPEGLTATDMSHALLPSPCGMASEAESFLRGGLERLAYLGPLRERPSRHYMYSGLSWPALDKSGSNLPEMLLTDHQILANLNEALRNMGADYQVEVVRPADPGAQGLFWLQLTDSRTGIPVSPTDVGFGVGQVLPVLTQLLVSKDQVLLFEQPEIHLHPRLEAELGSLFAKSISSPNNNQLIVETHSAYSGPIRPLIPFQIGRPFRSKSAAHSG